MSEQKVQRKNIDDIDLSQVFSDSENTSEKNSEINKSIEDLIRKKLKKINVNKNIRFKNFSKNQIFQKLLKFKKLIKSNSEIINSLSSHYSYSFSKYY